VARGVHQPDIQRALDQAPHQVFLKPDFAADGDIGYDTAYSANPLRQESIPERDSPADPDGRAVAARQTDIVPGLLRCKHQPLRMFQETPSRGYEAGA
jgi:hypothetical protein